MSTPPTIVHDKIISKIPPEECDEIGPICNSILLSSGYSVDILNWLPLFAQTRIEIELVIEGGEMFSHELSGVVRSILPLAM